MKMQGLGPSLTARMNNHRIMNMRTFWMAALSSAALAATSWAQGPGLEEPEEDGIPIPISADIEVELGDDKVLAHVGVTIEPYEDGSIYTIGDWGEPKIDGEVIYLDAQSNGPLESFNTEPVHERHIYCVFDREDDGGGQGGTIPFETVGFVPEILRPEQREEVVFRTQEDWDTWLERQGASELGLEVPAPVDFNEHTVVGIFLGKVIEGAGFEIGSIESDGDVLNVLYFEFTPDIIDGAPLFYHYPWQLVAIEKTDLPVLFNGRPPQVPDAGEEQEIKFESVELVPEWMRPLSPEDVVIRSDEEWGEWVSKHFPADVQAPLPGPPVDLSQFTLLGVFLGEVPQGIGILLVSVRTDGRSIVATAVESIPGVRPEEDLFERPGTMVAIPKTLLPVTFEREVLAFPTPPPFNPDEPIIDPEPGDPEPGDPVPGGPAPSDPEPGDPQPGDPAPGGPAPGDPQPGDPAPGGPSPSDPEPGDPAPGFPSPFGLPVAAQEENREWPPSGAYLLVFRVDGFEVAQTKFDFSDNGGGGGEPGRIPADADITIEQGADGVTAHVEVAFFDSPYHTISQWGPVSRHGPHHFVIDSTSTEVFFVTEPELPYYERNRFSLPFDDPGVPVPPIQGEPIDWREVEADLELEKAQNVVIESREQWWELIGFDPAPDTEPPADPIDFEEETLIGVFRGELPNGCYDVSIAGVVLQEDGVLLVHYQLRDPREFEACTEALVRPKVLLAVPKLGFEVDFIEHPDTGVDPEPVGPDQDGAGGGVVEPFPDEVADGDVVHVEFHINGLLYAATEFVYGDPNGGGGDPGNGKRIPAEAALEIEQSDDGAVTAHVEVAFTGAPYHSIGKWGPVTRHGPHFIIESTSTEIVFVREPDLPYYEGHSFPLSFEGGELPHPEPDPDPGAREPVDWQKVDADLNLEKQRNVVIETRDEWWDLIGFEPGPLVLPPPDPVDFEEETLIGIFRGARPNGCYGVSVKDVFIQDGVLLVHYQLRDPRPTEFCTQAIVFPEALLAVPKLGLPIDFIEHADPGFDPDVIPVEPDGGNGDGAEGPANFEPEVGEVIIVEFLIDGLPYAFAEFVYGDPDGGGNGGGPALPAKADLDLDEVEEGKLLEAHVEVAFTGAPYHTVADWGPVLQEGPDHFVLDAEAEEVQFVVEPELPYFERHVYRIPVAADPEPPVDPEPGNPDAIDFERVDMPFLQLTERRLELIQNADQWWDLLGVEPGPLVDPVPPPVDLTTHTLVAVFLGERPDTCYDVRIDEVLRREGEGGLEVVYRLREPRPDEGCGDAITYPSSMVAIEKTDLPADFIELPDDGGPWNEPIPVDGERVIVVEFRLNGIPLAHARHVLGGASIGDPDPDPDPDPNAPDGGGDGGLPDPVPPSLGLPAGFFDWLGQFLEDVPTDAEFAGGAEDDRDAMRKAFADANRDGDRWSDLHEFLLGKNPLKGDDLPVVRPEWIRDDAGLHFAVCFQRRLGAEEHAEFVIEVSRDLVNWVADPALVDQVEILDLGGGFEEVTVCLTAAAEEGLYRYLRVRLLEKTPLAE